MKWGNYELVYDKERKLFTQEHYKELFKYMDMFQRSPEENIWYDHSNPAWYYLNGYGLMDKKTLKSNSKEWWVYNKASYFSAAQTISTQAAGKNHSFITYRGEFLSGIYNEASAWMKQEYDTLKGVYKKAPEIVNTEFRAGFNEEVEKIHNQESVFIIGGGPSTAAIEFQEYADIPKWSMNCCYKNPKILDLEEIQMVTFLDSVDLEDPRLWNFLEKFQPLVAHEISGHGLRKIMRINNHYKKTTYYHTRYRSRLGCGPRMLIYAIMMGIKDIYISGFDGYDYESTNSETHSFELNKAHPGWLQEYGSWLQKQQLVIFWDYVLNTLRKTYEFRIHDLSKGQKGVQYDFIQEHIT